MSDDLGDRQNIDVLKSLGLSDEAMQKLLRMSGKDFRKLIPKTSPSKPRTETKSIFDRAKKTVYTVTYVTTCTTCKSVNKFTEDVPKKEYLTHHSSYRNGKANVKVSMCKGCKGYLKTLSREELMSLVMRTRPKVEGLPQTEMDRDDQLEMNLMFAHVEYPIVLLADHHRWMRGIQ